jgi:hypothetical protein
LPRAVGFDPKYCRGQNRSEERTAIRLQSITYKLRSLECCSSLDVIMLELPSFSVGTLLDTDPHAISSTVIF